MVMTFGTVRMRLVLSGLLYPHGHPVERTGPPRSLA